MYGYSPHYSWRVPLALSAFCAFLGIAIGAFAAHLLEQQFTPYQLQVFRVGVQYWQWQSLGLLLVGLIGRFWPLPSRLAWTLQILGMLIFSGSLWILAFTQVRIWGAITPIGGTLMLLGWLLLTFQISKNPVRY